MTTAEVLTAARGLIDTPEKWFGGGLPPAPGTRCAWIAIEEIECFGDAAVAAPRYFRQAVGGRIVDWNDTPGRTHAEVLAAFDRAIELARAGESQ